MYSSMSKAKSCKDRNEDPISLLNFICPLHAQSCYTGLIFSKSLQTGVAVKH